MNKGNNKIKIAFVINDFLMGGAQKLIIDQLKNFDYNKFDICLVTLLEFSERRDFYNLIPEHVKVYRMNIGSIWRLHKWVKFIQILKINRVNIIISHLFDANFMSRIAGGLIGVKVIIVEHNTYIYKKKWQIWADYFLSLFTSRIVAVSNTVRDFTIKQEGINSNKFITIHNGVDMESIKKSMSVMPTKDKLKEQLGFEISKKIIINVARLTPQKNHKLLIQSFVEFHKKYPEFILVILGDGNTRRNLESLVKKLSMEERIFIKGNKDNVFDYYCASEFFVSTSIMEGLSIAYLEAMAAGLPIIATKTAGTDEIIKDNKNGYFVSPEINSVVNTMIKMVNSDYGNFSRKAIEMANSFDIKSNVLRYEDLIIKCLF